MQDIPVLVFASGSKVRSGGSGFERLVVESRGGAIHNARIIGVVSNYESGGVRERADRLGIPFTYFPRPWTAEQYQEIAQKSGAKFFALSGWLRLVVGLDLATQFNPMTVFNIHPGPLPGFGGFGYHGHHVHEAVMAAYKRGEITHTEVCMHFVSIAKSREDYDRGPVFFRLKIKILPEDTADSLGKRVNWWEHYYQPAITDLVINGHIKWDGTTPQSLELASGYSVEHTE